MSVVDRLSAFLDALTPDQRRGLEIAARAGLGAIYPPGYAEAMKAAAQRASEAPRKHVIIIGGARGPAATAALQAAIVASGQMYENVQIRTDDLTLRKEKCDEAKPEKRLMAAKPPKSDQLRQLRETQLARNNTARLRNREAALRNRPQKGQSHGGRKR